MWDKTRRFPDLPAPGKERRPQPGGAGRVRRMDPSYGNGFFTYRYSYRSIATDGEKTYVTGREGRFENGKLETEEFEGTIGADAFTGAIAQMQKMMTRQMELFFKPFSMFLPYDDDEKKGRP